MSQSKSTATVGGSAIEFLSLAVKYAKERGMKAVPLPLDIANSVLEFCNNPPQESIPSTCEHGGIPSNCVHCQAPPPLEVTTLTPNEIATRIAPPKPGYVGIFKKAKSPRMPYADVKTEVRSEMMRNAGRHVRSGM